MMFFKKKENKDVQEIKKAIEDPQLRDIKGPELPPSFDDEEMKEELFRGEPLEKERFEEEMEEFGSMNIEEPAAPSRDVLESPLFVKVGKYKEILDLIQEMKTFNSSLKQIFAVINEAENVRNDALRIMRATVSRLDKALAQIDSEFARPRGIDLEKFAYAESEVKYVEKSLTDLQNQLSTLRKDLQELKE